MTPPSPQAGFSRLGGRGEPRASQRQHNWLQNPPGNLSRRTRREQALHSLCYQKHDLAGILERLRHGALQRVASAGLLEVLKEVCGTWTIYARYSPRQATMQEASSFLKRVRKLKKWLR